MAKIPVLDEFIRSVKSLRGVLSGNPEAAGKKMAELN